MQVNDMIQKEALYKDFLSRINCVFAAFAGSATFTAMPPPERNAIVSNLVETARFTAEEAAALGLTNVTTHVED